MVSIRQIYRAARQKLRNLPCQTGNSVAQRSCVTKLCNFVPCLTWALVWLPCFARQMNTGSSYGHTGMKQRVMCNCMGPVTATADILIQPVKGVGICG